MVAQVERADVVMTVEEYLALEETNQIKHEYVDGHVYAMAGGTIDHDRIANNVRTVIDTHLGDGPCMVLGPDVRLRVSPTVYYYPDGMVTCDETIVGEDVDITAPRLVIEVLSKSTEADDRGDKFAHYQTIGACEEYLLVNARLRVVERFHRSGQNLWLYQRYTADDSITLESIGLTCPVVAFYRHTRLA